MTPTVNPARPGFEDGQPFGQCQALAREGQGHVIEPGVHLLPDRGVELRMGNRPLRGLLQVGQGFFDLQLTPQFAQPGGQLRAVRTKLALAGKVFPQLQKGGGPLPAQLLGDGRFPVHVRPWPGPGFPFPAPGQGLVFQPVNGLFVAGNQPGFQRAEPVLVPPVISRHAQGVARQLGQRMVGGRLAAIQEKRNPVARENPPQHVVVAFQAAQQYRRLAKAPARLHKLQNLARGQHGFPFGVGAKNGAQRALRLRVPLVIGKWNRLRPILFQVPQDRIFREPAGRSLAAENFRLQPEARHGGKSFPTILPGLGDGRPDGEPGIRLRRPFVLHAKGQGHFLAAGGQRGQEAEFLRSQFAEAVQPEGGNEKR